MAERIEASLRRGIRVVIPALDQASGVMGSRAPATVRWPGAGPGSQIDGPAATNAAGARAEPRVWACGILFAP